MNVINLYGGPSSGKSTIAAGLFSLMKTKGYSIELVTEYAKDCVYEHKNFTLSDQLYVFAKQYHKLFCIKDKVDYAIVDSPLLLSCIYNKLNKNIMPVDIFNPIVLNMYNSFTNTDIFIKKSNKINFENNGRIHNEIESTKISNDILNFLRSITLNYKLIEYLNDNISMIDTVSYLLNKIQENNKQNAK